MRKSKVRGGLALIVVAGLATTGCTNSYDPGQRAVGGGLLGAGAGAAIGALAGGGRGAAIGALTGGAVGAGTGYITTPQQPSYPSPGAYYGGRGYPEPSYRGYGY